MCIYRGLNGWRMWKKYKTRPLPSIRFQFREVNQEFNFLFIGFYGVQDTLFCKKLLQNYDISQFIFNFFIKVVYPILCVSQCVHVCVHRKISERTELHIWWGVILEMLMNEYVKNVENSKIIKGKHYSYICTIQK